MDLLLKHGANYDTLNKNLQTPIAFCTESTKRDLLLDTCISQCITYEAFVDSVRGGHRADSGNDKAKKPKRQEIKLSYAQQQRLGFLSCRAPKSSVTGSAIPKSIS